MEHRKFKDLVPGHARAWDLRVARSLDEDDPGLMEEARLLRQYIAPRNFQEDRTSSDRCWYGYGYMSVFQRNEAFTRAYVQAFNDLWHKYSGTPGKPSYDPIHQDFIRNLPDVMNHMHRARQRADALGLRYDLYCRTVIDRLVHGRGNHQVPRPNQMGSDKTFLALQEGLDKLLDAQARNCLIGESDSRFQADQYVAHPAQLAALRELERSVLTHEFRAGKLWNFLRDGFISKSEARARFPTGLVDQALTRGAPKFAVNGHGNVGRISRPVCFGYAIAPASPECAGCPVRDDCGRTVAEVDARQVAVTGTSNPRQEHERAEARKRKQKERRLKSPAGLASAEGVRREICSLIPRLERKWPPNPEIVRLLREEGCHGP